MEELLQIGLGLFGGLALFLYGMNLMSNNLQEAAGERMRAILAAVTKNPFFGVLAGALATAVLQSSSATTVMTIGFVAAGLMGLRQAIPIIMGANIGTTITAQIIAFKLSDYVLGIVLVGFLIMQLAKQGQMKYVGTAVFGFGLLFLGIDTMGAVMKPLAENPVFTDLIAQVTGVPVLGVLVGTLMTLVVQSSSAHRRAAELRFQPPGADGASIIGLDGAIPILLGDNLGTTITALLAAIGQSRDAKRVALSLHLQPIGLPLVRVAHRALRLGGGGHPSGWPRGGSYRPADANAHTLFNATTDRFVATAGLGDGEDRHGDSPREAASTARPAGGHLETPLAPDGRLSPPLRPTAPTLHRRSLSRWFPVARRCRWGGTGWH
ncbi:MAG: Na/Pi cotransporter family protein [Collinsella sp.]